MLLFKLLSGNEFGIISFSSPVAFICVYRIRPQNTRELIDMCRVCTFCTPDTPQIVLGKDKAFTYDFVFDTNTTQEHLYTACVENLVIG